MKKFVALTLALATLVGCTTAPFNESKPLHYGTGFLREGYMQGQDFVEQEPARAAIETVPAAAEKLKSAQAYQWGSLGFLIGGIVIVNVVAGDTLTNASSRATGYWIGLSAIVASIPFSLMAQSRYRQAADAYNDERFVVKPKTSFYLSPLKDGGLAGLRLAF
jgi:hypothetical protein